jgi:hypothetical protein
MNKNIATINGLIDNVSVLEKNTDCEVPSKQSDILYNDKEPIDFGEFEGTNLLSIENKS